MRQVDREEAVRIDSESSARFGIPPLLLMECAGLASARLAILEAFTQKSLTFVVVAGFGNNGGDGLVAARHLANRTPLGLHVILCGAPAELERRSPESRLQTDIVSRLGIAVTRVETAADVSAAALLISTRGAFVIDALFGIGLRRALNGRDLDLVRAMNEVGAPTLALDVPSGLDCDTGAPLGDAVRATATITFGLPKLGLLRASSHAYTGRVAVAEIGFPRSLLGIERDETQPDFRWIGVGG